MPKVIVFLSHISEERPLAELVKTHVERDFLGLIDVFVSSDQQSVAVGARWLENIDAALKSAEAMLILCSPQSVRKPWINFEAGAGWVRGIPVAPICHTGIRPVDLPIPLSLLQATVASQESEWPRLYQTIAGRLGSETPTGQFGELVERVREFEHEYGTVREIRRSIRALIEILPDLIAVFDPTSPQKMISGKVPEVMINQMRPHLESLQARGFVTYSTGNLEIRMSGTQPGNWIHVQIRVEETFGSVANSVMAEV